VVEGASELCQQLGIVLLGGETAEMPDVYMPGEVDVAGCIVGLAEFQQIPTPSRVQVGDAVRTARWSRLRRACIELSRPPCCRSWGRLGG